MDGVTKSVSDYINDKGISINSVAEKTGISYNILYPSLCRNPTRKLRGYELLEICYILEVNPMRFFSAQGDQAS